MDPHAKHPIACRLDALTADERARRAVLIERMRAAGPTVRELPDGYVLRFEDQPDIENVIRELMPLEETCCPFLVLDFTALDPGVCEFRVRGPEGSKAIIVDGLHVGPGRP